MRNDQYTPRGETYFMCTDSSGNVFFRPAQTGWKHRGRGRAHNRRTRHSYQGGFRYRRGFMGHKGYIPDWFMDLYESVWDRMKLIWITAIVSPILFLKLPLVFQMFQP